jgi:membrane associated rhomboid family serine protease
VGLSLLRRLGSSECVLQLWDRARKHNGQPGAACPVCYRPMTELPVWENRPTPRLDVCVGCQMVWFDAREYEQFPPPDGGSLRPLPEKAREIIAKEQVRHDAERSRREGYDQPWPDQEWQWILGLLGLPVEEDAPALRSCPWLTWGLAAALVAVYLLTLGNLEAVVQEYGFVPALLWRHGGATWITNFFLHAGFWHLLGNVYFLLIFGDNVEDDLGHLGYAIMLAIAALVGDLWHCVGHQHDVIPAIGASGGISGIVTYYALRFPQARLGFVFRYWLYFQWVHIPAFAAMLFWFALQFVYVWLEHAGIGNVAALAHLGGAAVGVVAWFLWGSDSLRVRDAV